MNRKTTIFALYLPQYYETDYNNLWWGKGYTEWTACRNAKPLFAGHNQPRQPLNDNYYTLNNVDNIRWQICLAKKYGIDGFAIYHYYSKGNKLLEVPTELIRDTPSLDIPFFLYWVNSPWKKSWFGQDNSIVWEQQFGSVHDWKQHFEYCYTFFRDKRYLQIDGKPVFAIYDAWRFSNIIEMMDLWNEWALEKGLKGIYFVKTLNRHEPNSRGPFSAVVTREPNYYFAKDEYIYERYFRKAKEIIINFINNHILYSRGSGMITLKYSYDKIWKRILKRTVKDQNTILGAFTDWDNSPRRGYNSIVMEGASPLKFNKYFRRLINKAKNTNTNMIILNAWNEWAEGAYLEPDTNNQFAYLEAIKSAKDACFCDSK